MAKQRKPGAGRKKLPDDVKKTHIAFRVDPPLAATIKSLADRNARTVSGEVLFQIRERLKDIGEIKS